MSLQERTAVVTGGASGIGRALCQELARAGARVGILDLHDKSIDPVLAELGGLGIQTAGAAADVRDRAAVRQAVARLRETLGPIDLLVACAGIGPPTLVDNLDAPRVEAVVRTNLLGVAHSFDAVLPEMLARGQGQLVGVSSMAGMRGMPFSAAYSASKGGLAAYLESLRPELRRRGVFLTAVFPGFVRTPLVDAIPYSEKIRRQFIEPEDAARAIFRAIRRRSRSCAFPFRVRFGTRLLTWLPARAFDRIMGRFGARAKVLKY